MRHAISPLVKVLLSRILPWVFVLIGGVFLYSGNREMSSARSMADWARTEGHIISSSVESIQYGSSLITSPTYRALIVYEYRSGEMVFHGTRLSFGDHAFRQAADAQAVVNRYPVGRAVTVYYNPFNVTESVLEPGSPWQPYVALGIGGLFILVGICLAVFMRRLMRSEN
ncbi:MAG TPA: DUF3592 domain-containing protein [archaeon]|nr:DUF3592 domain-containing protein [archaeon]